MKKIIFGLQALVLIAALPLFAFLELNHQTLITDQPQQTTSANITPAVKAVVAKAGSTKKTDKAKRFPVDKKTCTADCTVKQEKKETELTNDVDETLGSSLPLLQFGGMNTANINFGSIEATHTDDEKLLQKIVQKIEKDLRRELLHDQNINCRCLLNIEKPTGKAASL